jgi:hypothetical protein
LLSGTLTGGLTVITPDRPRESLLSEFSEVVNAMQALASYANVHSDLFPGGEIRGQVTH